MRRFVAFGLALMLLGTGTTLAHDPEAQPAPEWPQPHRMQKPGVLSAKIGHGCLLTLDDEVDRVAMADDSIGRVQIINPREVLITALAPGRTTVHVWLNDGKRYRYVFHATRDLDLLRKALKDVDPDIGVEDSPQGSSVVLHGSVRDHAVARKALGVAESFLGGSRAIDMLDYPGRSFSRDERLAAALSEIDSRIRVRRLQVGTEPNSEADAYVLEGRVRTLGALVRAMTIADRQLGGTGGQIVAIDDEEAGRIGRERFRGFFGGGGLAAGGGSGGGGLTGVQGQDPRSTALATRVARGMVLTTESGRVVSLLEVDEIPQVSVSIRVMEVDRTKSRKAGVNFRIDAEHVSIGNYVSPQVDRLGISDVPSVDGLSVADAGNIVASFVDQTSQILAAFDFLQQKQFARSVAEPTILTLSGELASVLVGGEVPIETTTVGNIAAVSGFFFQEFGVRLDIRPTVHDNQTVALEVAPSIVRPTAALAVGSVPGFQVQSVSTTARVPAGQSLVIGGLLSFDEGLEDRRLPGLGKIPIFRWKRKTRAERELVFVITPRLVSIDRLDPLPAADALDHDELQLPELDWDFDRSHWRDSFEPRATEPDGVPSTFRPVGEGWEELAVGEYGLPVSGYEPPPADVEPYEAEPYESDYGAYESGAAGESADIDAGMSSSSGSAWVVKASPCLNVRPQPRMWSDPVACLPTGTRVESLDERGGDWVKVKLPDGREGWLAGSYLERAPVS